MISYSAFLSLWEKNHKKELRANKLRMLGSQANLLSMVGDDYDIEPQMMGASYSSIEECQEAAKARATFLMDKHGTLGNAQHVNVGLEDTMVAIPTSNNNNNHVGQQSIVEDDYEDDSFSMDGGIQI